MSFSRKQLIVGWMLVVAAALVARDLQPTAGSQKPDRTDWGQSFPELCLRVTFGLTDLELKSWDGELLPESGQLLEIREDRFRVHNYKESIFSRSGPELKVQSEPRFPNDLVTGPTAWVCSTRWASLHGPTTEWHSVAEPPSPVLQSPSLFVRVLRNERRLPIQIRTAQGRFAVNPAAVESFEAAEFLNGGVRVERVPATMAPASERPGQPDFPAILASKDDALWVAWQEFDGKSDSVCVKQRSSAGVWKPVSRLAEAVDAFRVALGEDSSGSLWCIWSAQSAGNWDLYGRHFDGAHWSKLQRLTDAPGPDVYHKIIRDSQGRLWLVWQTVRDGHSQIAAKHYDGKQWSASQQISQGPAAKGNNWWPSVAAGPDRALAVVWDGYAQGNYDVYLRRFGGGRWGDVQTIAGTARFEAHPSAAIDGRGRVWVAWDESDAHWGKDTGFLVTRKGTLLHESRQVRVVCVDGQQTLATAGDLSQALKPGEFWELPHLQVDRSGNPWLFVRRMLMRQPDTPLEGPIDLALWEIYATRYDGHQWTSPMLMPHSMGRNDMMPATAVDAAGNLWASWVTDGRNTRSYLPAQLQIQLARLEPAGAPAELAMTSQAVERTPVEPFDPEEDEDVRRIRSYRLLHQGKSYSIFRGDLHRHTDSSVDGDNDGSLLDAYRYARDAAALDFVGVSDHTDAVIDTYSWWRSQKVADLFQLPGYFAAFYGYERSVEYPNGHRNVFFAQRGNEVTPILAAEQAGWQGTGVLFAYLRRANGFSIPHTPGRTSGTDWRESDPIVETLVELYQGMRDSYEYPGAPRPKKLWASPEDASKPVPRASSSEASASFRRQGFVWSALDKGYKLGFIASSDHVSAHISYACLIARQLALPDLLEAVRNRRAYAATDNMILDIRFVGSNGEYLMGEAFVSRTPVTIKAKILGTGKIRQIDVIKNREFVYTIQPDQAETEFTFTDSKVSSGESYYYVRVIQADGEMAWGSPVWVTYPTGS
ncbi:MAG: DUF3604 domain-containing protein [Acidimicrobiia bacterium]|nr:DUF3604 domain-containing protein [Acidimicrobiia bacterium]